MKKHANPSPESTLLRRKAEEMLKMKKAEEVTRLSESDVFKLIHELQIYKVELEMQNEELTLAKNQAAELAAEKYDELYDFAPSGFFTLSGDSKIVRLNSRGADMLGKERSQLINKLFSAFVSDDTKPVLSDFLNLVFNSDHRESCVVTIQITGEDPVYVQLSGICYGIRDECLVTAMDITERIKAEELLKQNEALLTHQNELFSQLLKNLQIGVFMVEAPGGKPLLANEMALKLLGRGILPDANKYNLAEVYKAFKSGSHQPYPPDEMPILMGMNGISAHVDDMIVVRPDGTEIPLEISGTPVMDKHGNVWASLVSFLDITERKKAEAEIKLKNEELLKTNAEKDKFFSIIAHDLRSPFNAFLGLTQLMEEELPSLSPDEIQTFAGSMRKSANMLFHLLENLLEWSRMQRGLISFKPQTLLLSNEINAGIELVRDAAAKKNIKIRQDISGKLYIKADAQMFGSVIRNLIFNAVKFTPKNGEIILAAKKISDTMVQVSVSDTGIGMDQTLISKLFRLEEHTQRKGTEGEASTGLGLIICKDLIEKHGGTIHVESEVGKGSIFYLTVPVESEAEENPVKGDITPPVENHTPVRKLKVLIVEDDQISKLLITAALKQYCREMLFARTGIETVEITRTTPDIDLIMMDIQMPEMDGYEATRLIREYNKNVIIIAQTAFGLSGDKDKSIQAGCNDHISKPIDIVSLKRMIMKYFDK